MMMVVVMVVYDHHDLRLRRIRCYEAEEEKRSKPKLFSYPIMTRCVELLQFYIDLRVQAAPNQKNPRMV